MARILIVDDERLIQQLLLRLFERDGYECEVAGSPDEAREIRAQERFDLVLCDVDMPGGSGLGLVEDMRGQGIEAPLVMMSGIEDARLAAEAVDLGVEGYLVKPFQLDDVRSKVAEILGTD